MNTKFIVVDDDPVSNKICQYTICKVFEEAEVKCFEYPVEGLNYIATAYREKDFEKPTVLLLDINMPEINGWGFLDEFSKMSEWVRQQFTIYIVSTSIAVSDKEKAESNLFVKDYLEKPISSAALKGIISAL